MVTPKKMDADIRRLAVHVTQVQKALSIQENVEVAQIGKESKRASDALSELLENQKLPDNYKVAVVGRFKAGKSSFVNELLGIKLASEDTNPETAAVTTFKHGPEIKATIRFLGSEDWDKIKALYGEEPKHIDAHRVKKWTELGNPTNEQKQTFNLAALEQEFIRDGGHSIEIRIDSTTDKKPEVAFRQRLKEFTTGTKPHHCIVESIEIEVPADILDGNILLIDTPGLGDTERYRVDLTERVVEDVDAVLFLTKSGASYDQAEKDFLLSLLRKGTIQQVIVVVTQIDLTYQQHLDNAESNDEDPETLGSRIAREQARLKGELEQTLRELCDDGSASSQRYLEQLGDVDIRFTSAKLHRDSIANKVLPFQMSDTDPGGIKELHTQLLNMLSTESRLALVGHNIASGAHTILSDLQSVLESKLTAITNTDDAEVAEQKLQSFCCEFKKASERFQGGVNKDLTVLKDSVASFELKHKTNLKLILARADNSLLEFQKLDMGKHWRTRRSGYWGYMREFENRVANSVFPEVQEILEDYASAFGDFVEHFSKRLKLLSTDSVEIAKSQDISTTLGTDIEQKLRGFLTDSVYHAQSVVQLKETEINKLLSDFVTDDVSDRIDEARTAVSNAWGIGTTVAQQHKIDKFYADVKSLLADALQTYVLRCKSEFGQYLIEAAEKAPLKSINVVELLLEQAEDNIRISASNMLEEQRKLAQEKVLAITTRCNEVLEQCKPLSNKTERQSENIIQNVVVHSNLVQEQPPTEITASSSEQTTGAESSSSVAQPVNQPVEPVPDGPPTDESWAEWIQKNATTTLQRFCLKNSEKGWDYQRLFPSTYFAGTTRIQLTDAYLAKPHQLRNLTELLLHLSETAKPRFIELVTKPADSDNAEKQQGHLHNLATELFRDYGVTLDVTLSNDIHDRFVVFDTGILFKLGRGLDIYKPATGLASHRPDLRLVRQTDIDVFCTAAHPLAEKLQTAVAM
jgi:predicted GTPase/ElaB/YqjD/DUF883 family membrane-anchored ribosome-binding protein